MKSAMALLFCPPYIVVTGSSGKLQPTAIKRFLNPTLLYHLTSCEAAGAVLEEANTPYFMVILHFGHVHHGWWQLSPQRRK
jgi:hypothetical protein